MAMTTNTMGYSLYKRQLGTALITVILIAAMLTILVVESTKTILFQKQLSSNLINRDQAYSYLIGMEELAKILLKRAFEQTKDKHVHLEQPWAKENIQFPFDGGMMVAKVKDMQSCFNLNSIGNTSRSNNSQTNANSQQDQTNLNTSGFTQETIGQKMFEELISKINNKTEISAKALATATRDWLDDDDSPAGPDGVEDDYYMTLDLPYRTANDLMGHASELRAIKDFNGRLYSKLLPHICVLPDSSVDQLNVNTISKESAVLLYALLDNPRISLSDVEQAIGNRPKKGYEAVEDFLDQLSITSKQAKNSDRLTVTSNYFQVDAKAELGDTRVYMKSLFFREQDNTFKLVSRYFGKE
jgi:general secretion pathway protein K